MNGSAGRAQHGLVSSRCLPLETAAEPSLKQAIFAEISLDFFLLLPTVFNDLSTLSTGICRLRAEAGKGRIFQAPLSTS